MMRYLGLQSKIWSMNTSSVATSLSTFLSVILIAMISYKISFAVIFLYPIFPLIEFIDSLMNGKIAWTNFLFIHSDHNEYLQGWSTSLEEPRDAYRDLEGLMSTHTSVLVDSVGPPSAVVCRAAASFP
jgi:hypothetical protein